MSGILLDIGNLANPLGELPKAGDVIIDTTASERIVYPQATEQFIVVQPGHMVVLTAYNFANDDSIVEIQKILTSNGSAPIATGGSSCCPTISSSESVVLARVVIPCYEMNPCNPITVISIPGKYAIASLEGVETDLKVTAVDYPLQQDGPSTDCGGC